MQPEAVAALISADIPEAEVRVTGDGSHFDAIVISRAFAGLSLLNRQRKVYASVNEQIANGELHALSIKAFTPEEWTG